MPILELKLHINIHVVRDGDGFYAHCPELQGLLADGDNISDLKKNVQDAVSGYIKSLIKHNDPLPAGIIQSCREVTFSQIIREKVQDFIGLNGNNYVEEFSVPYQYAS